MEEEVYMVQPLGLESNNTIQKQYADSKSLSTAANNNSKITQYLHAIGFRMSKYATQSL